MRVGGLGPWSVHPGRAAVCLTRRTAPCATKKVCSTSLSSVRKGEGAACQHTRGCVVVMAACVGFSRSARRSHAYIIPVVIRNMLLSQLTLCTHKHKYRLRRSSRSVRKSRWKKAAPGERDCTLAQIWFSSRKCMYYIRICVLEAQVLVRAAADAWQLRAAAAGRLISFAIQALQTARHKPTLQQSLLVTKRPTLARVHRCETRRPASRRPSRCTCAAATVTAAAA